MKPPVAVGERVTLDVVDLGTSGDGVARYDDYVVFVSGAVPGDRALVEIDSVGSSFARGRVRALSEASTVRTQPRCPLYGDCGGCQLQHVDYGAQCEYKARWIEQALRRIGRGHDARVAPIRPSEDVFGYRHRMRFTAAVAPGGRLSPSLYSARGGGLVSIPHCPVQAPLGNRVLAALHRFLDAPGVASDLRWGTITVAVTGTEALVVFGTGTGSWESGGTVARDLVEEVDGVVGVVRNVALDADLDARRPGMFNLPLAGRDHLRFRVDDLDVRASAGVFSQVNPSAAREVYALATDMVDPGPGDTVLELFSGIGLLSLLLARRGAFVIGVERDGAAVSDARGNAVANGCDAMLPVNADATEGLLRVLEAGTRPDVVVVDPPRSGCSRALLDAIVASGADRLVYISCHFGSWARDLGYLDRLGWGARRVVPVDMFPHTTSVELVSLVQPRGTR